jgi:hypothetical protein
VGYLFLPEQPFGLNEEDAVGNRWLLGAGSAIVNCSIHFDRHAPCGFKELKYEHALLLFGSGIWGVGGTVVKYEALSGLAYLVGALTVWSLVGREGELL